MAELSAAYENRSIVDMKSLRYNTRNRNQKMCKVPRGEVHSIVRSIICLKIQWFETAKGKHLLIKDTSGWQQPVVPNDKWWWYDYIDDDDDDAYSRVDRIRAGATDTTLKLCYFCLCVCLCDYCFLLFILATFTWSLFSNRSLYSFDYITTHFYTAI